MKVISIWQPFASLIVSGSKVFETRTWPAPKSVIGQTIGIASTKTIRPEQRAYFKDEEWVAFYERTGLPMDFESMPCGYLLGTVTLDSVELMTEEFMDEVSVEEQAYGYWQEGFYAWRLTNVYRLPYPIPIRGAQGLFEWNGILPDGSKAQIHPAASAPVQQGSHQVDDQTGPQRNRCHLRVV